MIRRELNEFASRLNGPSRVAPIAIACAAAWLLSSCATPPFSIPAPIAVNKSRAESGAAQGEGTRAASEEAASTGLFQTPPPPAPERVRAGPPSGAPTAPAVQGDTALVFEQMPLPVFVQTVFGSILKRNVSMDAAVTQRTDLVTLRTGQPQSPQQIFDLARGLLKSYGIAVSEFGNLVRVTPDTAQTGYLPELRRGRALPETPAQLRPVFQLVELQAVPPQSVSNWLRSMFGSKVNVQDDTVRNGVLLSGQSDDVAAAIEAIQMLDQPLMRGRVSARIAPRFWAAEELAKRLAEVLAAEGYTVSNLPIAQAPVIALPIGPLNSVIVFAVNESTLNHALRWATDLDQPGTARGTAGYFTYAVRNTDAASLAKTLQEIISGGAAAAPTAQAPGQPLTRARVVVNPGTNSLIIQGNSLEYQQWLGLLQELDRPARSAMISVTVAEVRLTDSEQFGFEFLVREFLRRGYSLTYGTLGGLGVPTSGGVSAVLTSPGGDPRAVLNALASNNRVRVLSNPSIVARNGETAAIQVGQEVPVITSQQSNANTNLGTGGILQTIQYRQVGVILQVKPVIHSSGRIELDVKQEVSSATQTQTGVTASPTISTRRIETRLSVADSSTVLLGGLMQRSYNNSDTGVPLLKDIPAIGSLFSNRTNSTDITELVVLITPYVIENDFEAAAITDAFRSQFKWAEPLPQIGKPPVGPAARPSSPAAPEQVEPPAPRSRPYELPPEGASPEKSNVAPAQQSSGQGMEPSRERNNTASSPKGVTEPVTRMPAGTRRTEAEKPRSPSEGGVVTDEELLKELREAVKGKK